MQTARILDAAGALFRARGYRKTDLEDIAQSVGLARNSLYRYYGNKDWILLACVARDMAAYVEELKTLGSLYPDPVERIGAWLDMQIDIATSPAHATLELIAEIRDGSPGLSKQLRELHEAPAAALAGAITELLRGKRRDAALLTALVRGVVGAAATEAMQRDNKATIKRELRRAVMRILDVEQSP